MRLSPVGHDSFIPSHPKERQQSTPVDWCIQVLPSHGITETNPPPSSPCAKTTNKPINRDQNQGERTSASAEEAALSRACAAFSIRVSLSDSAFMIARHACHPPAIKEARETERR